MSANSNNHLKALIQLSFIDGKFDAPEKDYVLSIAEANGIKEEEIDLLIKDIVEKKEIQEVNYQGLLDEERIDYLYDIIQLMKIDGEVYLSEIKYCESVAEKLGFDKGVVIDISSRVYSDPNIKADKDLIASEALKYLKK